MENFAEFYFEKLKGNASTSPGATLAALLCSSYDIEVTRSEIILCNKLTRIFGRFIVFFSIIDMVGSCQSLPDTVYPYLYTICKRRFESAHAESIIQSQESLATFVKALDKKIELLKLTELKPPSVEGLSLDDAD